VKKVFIMILAVAFATPAFAGNVLYMDFVGSEGWPLDVDLAGQTLPSGWSVLTSVEGNDLVKVRSGGDAFWASGAAGTLRYSPSSALDPSDALPVSISWSGKRTTTTTMKGICFISQLALDGADPMVYWYCTSTASNRVRDRINGTGVTAQQVYGDSQTYWSTTPHTGTSTYKVVFKDSSADVYYEDMDTPVDTFTGPANSTLNTLAAIDLGAPSGISWASGDFGTAGKLAVYWLDIDQSTPVEDWSIY